VKIGVISKKINQRQPGEKLISGSVMKNRNSVAKMTAAVSTSLRAAGARALGAQAAGIGKGEREELFAR